MKSSLTAALLAIFLTFNLVSWVGASQDVPIEKTSQANPQLPEEIGGTWRTYDGAGSNTWSVYSMKGESGVLNYYGSRNRRFCNSTNIPVSVKFDGSSIEVTALKPMSCGNKFTIKLDKVKDTDTFKGKINTNFFPEKPQYEVLDTEITVRLK